MWKRKTMTLLLAFLLALQPLGVLFAQEQVPAEERREEEQVIAVTIGENKATDPGNTSGAAFEEAKQPEAQEPDEATEKIPEQVEDEGETVEKKLESGEAQPSGEEKALFDFTLEDVSTPLAGSPSVDDPSIIPPWQPPEIIIVPTYTGWKLEDGQWHYYEDDMPYTGWLFWEGSYYYIDNGLMATHFKKVEGEYHYFGANGIWQGKADGWYYYEYNWRYFKEGSLYTGWLQYDQKWYYIIESYMLIEFQSIGGVWHFFGTDGVWKGVANGWYSNRGIWRYFEAGSAYTGWLEYGGKWYYMENSYMLTGLNDMGGVWHDFGTDGIWKGVANGWYDVHNFGTVLWIYMENGHASSGWKQIDGLWYYFDPESKVMLSDWMLKLGGEKYYLSPSGAMHTGWLFYKENWYYFKETGAMHVGWLLYGNNWYYLDGDTGMLKGKHKIDGQWHNFADNGVWLGYAEA